MFNSPYNIFHPLDLGELDLPSKFTFPFYYDPHPLCVKAADEVQQYLENQLDFEHNFGLDKTKKGLVIGKMFGVMVVQANNGQLGYLAAFSGKIAERNDINGFVPPVFDTLNKEGFYKKGEKTLNELNSLIESLERSDTYKNALLEVEDVKLKAHKELSEFKAVLKEEKLKRQSQRNIARQSLDKYNLIEFEEKLNKQSIYLHFRLKDLKNEWKEQLQNAEDHLYQLKNEIDVLKSQRKSLSSELQRQLHKQYQFLNAKGESKDLLDIFNTQPPAAAGECAAPKLLQYAYSNNLEPIAMAEFWWGASPPSQVRRHKQFYPACRSKCEPILGHMMQGLNVAPSPIEQQNALKNDLEIIYEDDYIIVINKPEEVLSVPGKRLKDSVLTQLKQKLPEATGPLLLHRLDMSTSGLLVAAKNAKTYKNLQKQFIMRTVRKRYVAVLDGVLKKNEGIIDLPLRVDLDNRPHQLVCYEYGKPAQSKFKVIESENGKTRVHLFPITGRTHQLRVHAAHHLGLGVPIVGDDLYGQKGNRLHLHAETLSFEHPVSKKTVSFKSPCPF